MKFEQAVNAQYRMHLVAMFPGKTSEARVKLILRIMMVLIMIMIHGKDLY